MEKLNCLRMLLLLIKELREIDPNMGLQTASVLLIIALDEGIGVTEVAKRMDSTLPQASRNVDYLSKTKKHAKAGFSLVEARYDAYERRRKVLTLTTKGRKVIDKLIFVCMESLKKRRLAS